MCNNYCFILPLSKALFKECVTNLASGVCDVMVNLLVSFRPPILKAEVHSERSIFFLFCHFLLWSIYVNDIKFYLSPTARNSSVTALVVLHFFYDPWISVDVVVRIHQVISRKGKSWKRGQKVKFLKGACTGCHKNNMFATLEYFLLEGFEREAGGKCHLDIQVVFHHFTMQYHSSKTARVYVHVCLAKDFSIYSDH